VLLPATACKLVLVLPHFLDLFCTEEHTNSSENVQVIMERNASSSFENAWTRMSAAGEKQMYADTKGTSFSNVAVRHTVGTVGLLESTILPSISIHGGLAILAYGVAVSTDRLEVKDLLWPSAQVTNVIWSAVGSRMYHQDISFPKAWSTLGWNEKVLVAGMTLWGGRLFSRVLARTLARGEDDARYVEVKDEKDFWSKALFTKFLPEALFQAVITLPFTISFRALPSETFHAPNEWYTTIHSLAVGLFSAGFVLETLADAQLDKHKLNSSGLKQDGVWSIVRHPNYLGDALIHASFPLLLYGSGMLHPLALLGPAANYVYLRYVGGDRQTETSQRRRYSTSSPEKFKQFERYSEEKNSFWPSSKEVKNPWLWGIIGSGVAGVLLEKAVSEYF